ncbi:hypothetical protein PO124_04895 [Bacillus licheniformis]|nr:hypothetical protein [Bacillus licheniformis]
MHIQQYQINRVMTWVDSSQQDANDTYQTEKPLRRSAQEKSSERALTI